MIWETTRFERQKLFDEVWTTPVTKLAKGYGLSDVGLRKICVALDVPLPPRGYWQKLAAGKTIPKPVLQETTAKTSYARSMYVAEVDEVLEERVAQARDATLDTAALTAPDYSPPLDPTGLSSQAKLVVRAMKSTKLDEGALTSVGVTWADISVSPVLKERAIFLVDRLAHELEVLGAKFENTHPPLPPLRRGMRREAGSKRNCFTLHGQRYFVRIQERITQELVPPPPPKPLRAGARQPAWEYRPLEYRYIPTGKVFASIVDASTYYETYKVEDTVRGTIEVKIRKAVRWVDAAALRHNVEKEVRVEREAVRRRKSQEWDVAKANKDALLATLAGFEKMAKDLDRARSLRRFIDEIAASKAAPAELIGSLKLMALMADWLDPLVKASWPEVDGVDDRNPHGGLW
ncbi:hypothetical protein [Massilia aquatica]|uniref:Transposase n=1 Tax=Massilia aquatica TaxID=2609000 RepID=A0ABX0M6D6_9BURK|nr:hypothetical protein [Massilia aquatica]NHZ42492.1 hypothetical protein [Massilia aquatica]